MADATYASSPIMLDGTGQRIATALEAYNGTLETRLKASEDDITELSSLVGAVLAADGSDSGQRLRVYACATTPTAWPKAPCVCVVMSGSTGGPEIWADLG